MNQALSRQELIVSQEDVEREVARAAESMGFQTPEGKPDVSTWLEQISKENKQSIEFYLTDIVRPTVALKKLVGPVSVTQDDLDKAFTATFGPRRAVGSVLSAPATAEDSPSISCFRRHLCS